jgi:hypothetical protein
MISALLAVAITVVPMYATPAARQLPLMLGGIAGATILEPPRDKLGDYIEPGDLDWIRAWLSRSPAVDANAFVLSTDMLAYGGLDPARVWGGVDASRAKRRLQVVRELRARRKDAWIAAFGTVMRLEPTAVVPVGEAAHYTQVAQPPTWEYIWEYAQLHDPPTAAERPRWGRLRALIGPGPLDEYLATRRRDEAVDAYVLRMAAEGSVNRVVLGADDAGPVGLHVRDIRALREVVPSLNVKNRAAIEPGADELAAVLVAHAIARADGFTPHVGVHYSTPNGAATQDPLEFAPISVTIGDLIRLSGGVRDDVHPNISLFVRVPHTTQAQDTMLLNALRREIDAGRSVALVDLTYLTGSYAQQEAFVHRLLRAGLAGRLDAYSSWNTDANSVGIALAEAIAANAGRRKGTYDAAAHADFVLDRYIDDYLYHDVVRPLVNAGLRRRGVEATYYLSAASAAYADRLMQQLMYPRVRMLLAQLYPQARVEQLEIDLPWPRTAEIESQIQLSLTLTSKSRGTPRSFPRLRRDASGAGCGRSLQKSALPRSALRP